MLREHGATIIKDSMGFLEPGQVRAIIEAAPNQRDRLLVELHWFTGCRISEAVGRGYGTRPKDLEYEPEPVVIMRTLKRKREPPSRRVPVPRNFLERLGEFAKDTDPEQRIFPLSRQRAAQLIIRAGKLAGITRVGDKPFHPHHLRHSHSIAYIRGDSSIEGLRKLQMRLGHTSISTTGHYLNFSQRGEAKKIEEIFGRGYS